MAARGDEGIGEVALDDPDFWSKTVGSGYKSPSKQPHDRSARAARGGHKMYDEAGRAAYYDLEEDEGGTAYDRVKKKRRKEATNTQASDAYLPDDDEDLGGGDAPVVRAAPHPYNWSKTQIRELRMMVQKRPVGLRGAAFVMGAPTLSRREDPADAMAAARDYVVSLAKAQLTQMAFNADETAPDGTLGLQHDLDRIAVVRLIKRNKALKHALKHLVLEHDEAADLTPENFIDALIRFENTPGPLGVELCASGRDADGKHAKALEVCNDLETCRVFCERVDAYLAGRRKGDSTSLQHEYPRSDAREASLHASSAPREMIARPAKSSGKRSRYEVF